MNRRPKTAFGDYLVSQIKRADMTQEEFYHAVDCQTSLPKRMDILRKISFLKGIFYLVCIFKLRVVLVFTEKFTRKFRIPPSSPYTILLIIVCSIDILCGVFYNS